MQAITFLVELTESFPVYLMLLALNKWFSSHRNDGQCFFLTPELFFFYFIKRNRLPQEHRAILRVVHGSHEQP
jgi:hypothetical protein